MCKVTEYLDELNSEITVLEQISSNNRRLSEEKQLTKHLVEQVRVLIQVVNHQLEGSEIDPILLDLD